MIKTKIYDSGLQLVVEETSSPCISFGAMVKVGSQDEREHEEGFAHFIEHLMFKSTASRTTEKIASELEFLGSEINAYTCKTHTCYHFKAISENFEDSLKVYADMLQNGLLLQSEVDTEREVVVEEMNRSEDNPNSITWQELDKNMFGGSKLAHRVLGSKEVIRGCTIEQLKDFRDRFYTGDNIVISISGGISFEDAEKMVKKHFPKYFEKTATPRKYDTSPLNSKIVDKFVVYDKDDKQVNYKLAINGVNMFDRDVYVQNLYSVILGGGMSSRLFKTLREQKSLAYSVGCFDIPNLQNGQVVLFIGTTKDKLKTAVTGMKEILYDMAKNGVSAEELDKAKNQLKASLVFGCEQTMTTMLNNAEQLTNTGKIETINDKLAKINAVTASDIKKFAQRIFLEEEYVSVACGKNIDKQDLAAFETCIQIPQKTEERNVYQTKNYEK